MCPRQRVSARLCGWVHTPPRALQWWAASLNRLRSIPQDRASQVRLPLSTDAGRVSWYMLHSRLVKHFGGSQRLAARYPTMYMASNDRIGVGFRRYYPRQSLGPYRNSGRRENRQVV